MTFSIVATDGTSFGVAVASKFLAVGSVVPGARAGVGAVATQAFARTAYIDELLTALASGEPVPGALARHVDADDDRDDRQVGVVGVSGQATYTGNGCYPWAGGVTGRIGSQAYAIQGNVLVGPHVIEEMERAWLASDALPVPRRLVVALLAGDAAGGDRRGRQSAALYVQRTGAGYDGGGVEADLRVDDHDQAATELHRLLDLSELYFGQPEDVQTLEGDLEAEVRGLLNALGIRGGTVAQDLAIWAGNVNLETRLTSGGIDARVLNLLRATRLNA